MINKKINNIYKTTILIAPLDWGLGHATRCVPIIKELLKNNCNVIIGAEAATASLLKKEFPELLIIQINGYRIKYSKKIYFLPFKIFIQIPRILKHIYKEHLWVKKVVKKHSINAIISDNRFGLFHSNMPSIFITHQLLVKTGHSFSEKIIQNINHWFIQKYKFCWIPDFKGSTNIAGELSHPKSYPKNVQYIGGLSRFEKQENVKKKYELLIILSGPEPQRTIFENILLSQLKHTKGPILLVRGLPENDTSSSFQQNNIHAHVQIVNHLTANDLNDAMLQSKLVISRSGYTTVMDLIKLQQKAILVPTPGQTEQLYLADNLYNQQLFYTTPQEGFNLMNAIEQATNFSYKFPDFNMNEYKIIVSQFVESLKTEQQQKMI